VRAGPGRRADPADYRALDLHAHRMLADVPLHDVWTVDLPGGPPDCRVAVLRPYLSFEALSQLNPAVRGLFGLRRWLGRLFRWDGPEPPAGTPARRDPLDGPFRVVHESDVEIVGEVENRTVHAFSVLALCPVPGGYRAWWAIYVAPVGRITALYMALIDPFRRFLVYPAILRHVQRCWRADHA